MPNTTHKYIYKQDANDDGHIKLNSDDACLCGLTCQEIIDAAPYGPLSTILRFKQYRGLCKTCQDELKKFIIKKYPALGKAWKKPAAGV